MYSMRLPRFVFLCCLWIAPGLLSFAAADIAFVSAVQDSELLVTCTTSDETVELLAEGDIAVFPKSNGGGVKCNVVVATSRCVQSLQADLDPVSGLVDAKNTYTWTITPQGLSLDDQEVIYGWTAGCFGAMTALPIY